MRAAGQDRTLVGADTLRGEKYRWRRSDVEAFIASGAGQDRTLDDWGVSPRTFSFVRSYRGYAVFRLSPPVRGLAWTARAYPGEGLAEHRAEPMLGYATLAELKRDVDASKVAP